MKVKSLIYLLFIPSILILQFTGCKKTDSNSNNSNNPIVFNPQKTYDVLTDQSGNIYRTITIGTQTWMAENLKTTKYRNGDPIPDITNNSSWGNLTTGAYCDFNNNSSNSKIYGKLYNYYSILDSRNIAPSGWHVATTAEWNVLLANCGGWATAGDTLKESGVLHWFSPNSAANNGTGFTALPGSSRNDDGSWEALGIIGYYGTWWSYSTNPTYPYSFGMDYSTANVVNSAINNKTRGFSVRCVKDN